MKEESAAVGAAMATTKEILERRGGGEYADLYECAREASAFWSNEEDFACYLAILVNGSSSWDLSAADVANAARASFAGKTGAGNKLTRIEKPPEMPDHLLSPGGLIEDWMDYTGTQSFTKQPQLWMAGAVAACGAIMGRKVRSVMGSRTNLYIVGVARTGTGKDSVLQANKKLLTIAGMGLEGDDPVLGPEDIASDSGLQALMASQPSALVQIDEIGKLLRSMSGLSAPNHLANIATVLLKLYTSAASIYTGKAYADRSKVLSVREPCLCLFGCTVGRSLYEGMTTEAMTDGMLARMMIIHGQEDPEEIEPEIKEPSDDLIQKISQWRGYMGNLGDVNPCAQVVPRDDGAKEVFRDMKEMVKEERAKQGDNALGDLWTRCIQKADQLSLVHACSRDGRAAPIVNRESAEWARDLSVYCIRRMIYDCRRWVADNEIERSSKMVEAIIRDSGHSGISLSQLSRRTRSLTATQRGEILRDLVQMGVVDEMSESMASRGRPLTHYYARR